jgi:formylglycine-generating enzyme required for sulfatase activity
MKAGNGPGDTTGSARGAEDIYAEFLRRQLAGDPRTFEDLLKEYPQIAAALRGLHSLREHPAGNGGASTVSVERLLLAGEDSAGVARAAAPRDADFQPGEIVGGYTILGPPKKGGFSAVYPAEQQQPRRTVALKVIQPARATDEVLARFEIEAEALARMSHPAIAQVFDVGQTSNKRPFVVMEFVDGPPITVFCDKSRLTVRERIDLFLVVCEAMQHAHQKGIIHRDLKPSNVLVAAPEGGRPLPKVIDFGLAKILQADPALDPGLTAGGFLGTPQYMSPEQAGLAGGDVDTRADVYSLGVLLYELLVGAVPFEFQRPDLLDILRTIREEEPASPRRKLSGLGDRGHAVASSRRTEPRALSKLLRGDLEWILRKTLAKERERRYGSPAELAADLRRYLGGMPVLAGLPGPLYRIGKFAWRHRVGLGVAAAVLVPLCILGTVEYLRTLWKARVASQPYEALSIEVRTLHKIWEDAKNGTPDWAPVWERGLELEVRGRVRDAAARIEPTFNDVVMRISGALAYPRFQVHTRELTRLLDATYAHHYRSERGGQQPLAAFGQDLAARGFGPRDFIGGPQTLRLASDPSGAEVHCFRYEEHEARLFPFPFDPRAGAGDPHGRVLQPVPLVVEQVDTSPETLPLEVGDRLLVVRGKNIEAHSDLAAALRGVVADEIVEVRVLRDGSERSVSWVPFPRDQVERQKKFGVKSDQYANSSLQFGFTFSSYPLQLSEWNLCGVTDKTSLLSLTLPPGSYLLVLRKPGHVETRVPVAIPTEELERTIRLPRMEEIPPGFIYVPGGVLATGDDPLALDTVGRGRHVVRSFFMSRLEVTQAEWLEFANDQEVLARTNKETGRARPDPEVLRESGAGLQEFPIVSRYEDKKIWDFDEGKGRWRLDPRLRPRRPAYQLSYHAALEYVHWRTRKARAEGKPWTYRLPTDVEWERAARGEDGRYHVWGDYLVWSYCVSLPGNFRRTLLDVGISPVDESVFGVRDLAGSVAEFTSDKTSGKFVSYRGGFYDSNNDYMLRAGTRNGVLPGVEIHRLGIRLVADPSAAGGPGE